MGCAASSASPEAAAVKPVPNVNNSGLGGQNSPTEKPVAKQTPQHKPSEQDSDEVKSQGQRSSSDNTAVPVQQPTGKQTVTQNPGLVDRGKAVQSDVKTAKATEDKPAASAGTSNTGGKSLDTVDQSIKGTKQQSPKDAGKAETKDRTIVELATEDQRKFDSALRCSCLLVKQESILKHVNQNVTKFHLARALPQHIDLTAVLQKLTHLKDLDLSNNSLGPQGFRAVCLAMCCSPALFSLNLAGNRSDTDSAECLGKLLRENTVLQYLDVSSNYLGKDFFSRSVGPALKENTALKTLRCESIGSTDVRLLLEGLKENSSITDLDVSGNSVTDRSSLGKGLADCLKKPGCVLSSLALRQCGMNATGLQALQAGLADNSTLRELNLAGNEFGSLDLLLQFLVSAGNHPCLNTLCMDSAGVQAKSVQAAPVMEKPSSLQVLSLKDCGLTDSFFTELLNSCQGKLLSLTDIDVTANADLTSVCLDSIMKLTSDEGTSSCLRRLTCGLNPAEDLPGFVASGQLPWLQYLNLRMCRISPAAIGSLGTAWGQPNVTLSTLILDGLKMSGTQALSELFATAKSGGLSAISLGGCALVDGDLSPLSDSLKNGLQLHMLKLSANRITDAGVTSLVEAVLKTKTHPLAVLDLSSNNIEDEGAKTLCRLFTTKSHTSKLHSLNVSRNSIGKAGLMSLVAVVGGKSSLQSLHTQHQTTGQDELDMIDIFSRVAASLGFKVQMEAGVIKGGIADLPVNLPGNLLINMTGLGGNTGDIGKVLDSPAIQTDHTQDRLPSLSFTDVNKICCFLKGLKSEVCVWSVQEWDMITGANRATTDTPAWLKVSKKRDLAIYLSNLPGNTTQQKVEALLEMDADCSLDEACLMKDPVTRNINGVGWAVMMDEESVQKAVDFFNAAEAKIFGQAFMISRVKVEVDDEASSAAEETAREEQEKRRTARQAEEAAHRTLIQNTTEESWKRHAYRLAHPAYADGRIW